MAAESGFVLQTAACEPLTVRSENCPLEANEAFHGDSRKARVAAAVCSTSPAHVLRAAVVVEAGNRKGWVEVGSLGRSQPFCGTKRLELSAKVVAWNNCGSCLCIGDELGFVSFVNSEGVLLFSQQLLKDAGTGEFECIQFVQDAHVLFQDSAREVSDDLLVIGAKTLFRFSNLNLGLLQDAADSQNKSLLRSVRESAKFEKFSLEACGRSAEILTHKDPLSGFLRVFVASMDKGELNVWTAKSGQNLVHDAASQDFFEPAVGFKCASSIGNDSSCVLTLNFNGRMTLWDSRKARFLRTFANSSSFTSAVAIDGSRVAVYDQKQQVFQILQIGRSLNCVFSADAGNDGSFVFLKAAPCTQCLLFDVDLKGNQFSFKLCSENDDTVRFQSMLENDQFDEAISFAKESKLEGIERAYFAKLSALMGQLKAKEDNEIEAFLEEECFKIFDALVAISPSYLSTIVERCLNINLESSMGFYKKLLMKCQDLCEFHDINHDLLPSLRQAHQRLSTYWMLLGEDKDLFRSEEWHQFRMCEISDALRLFLSRGELQKSAIVLHRHFARESASTESVVSFLDLLPSETDSTSLAAWIQFHIERFIQTNEDRTLLTEWGLREIERSESIVLAESIQRCLLRNSEESRLIERLRQDLVEMHFVQETLEMHFDLNSFRELSKLALVVEALNRVTTPELIASQIEGRIRPCILRYGLTLEKVVLKYISNIGVSSAKEQCAIDCLKFLEPKSKPFVEGLLMLMRTSLPPYSEGVTEMIEEASSWSEEVLEQRRLMDLRGLLSKHRQNVNVDISEAKSLLNFVLARDGASKEAVSIAEAYQCIDLTTVFSSLIENLALVEHEKNEAIDEKANIVLDMIPTQEMKARVRERVYWFCFWGLDDETSSLDERKRMVELASSMKQQETFGGLLALQDEFGILLSPRKLQASTQDDLFAEFVAPNLDSWNHSSIVRLNGLLELSPSEAAGKIALKFIQEPKLQEASKWIAMLDENDTKWKQRLSAELIRQNLDRNRALHLLQECFLAVHERKQGNLIRTFRKVEFVVDVLKACDFDWTRADDAPTVLFHADWFLENGNVLTEETAFPLAGNFVQKMTEESGGSLMRYLTTNSARMLALRGLTLSYPNPLEELDGFRDDCVKELSRKMLCASEIDANLIFGFLLAHMSSDDAFSLFRSSLPNVKTDFCRLRKLAGIGTIVGKQNFELAQLAADCDTMFKNAKWWNWLQELKVDFQYNRFLEMREIHRYIQQELLKPALICSGFDLLQVTEFAGDYGIKPDIVDSLMLKLLFLEDDHPGPAPAQQVKVLRIIQERMNKALLTQVCKHIFSRVSRDYCKLQTLCSLAKWPDQGKELEVLELLQASNVSVDFHALFGPDPWPALEEALQTDTVKWLVALSDPLDLDPDDFYLCLVRKLVKRSGAQYNHKPEALLPELENVQDKQRVVQACEWILLQLETREAHLKVLKFALAQCASSRTDLVEKTRRIATELDLSQSPMAGMKYDRDWKPARLIQDAYEEFALQAACSWQEADVLHNFSRQVSRRHELELPETLKALVWKWLSENRKNNSTEEENMSIKIAYVVSEQPPCVGVPLLMSYVFQSNAAGRTYASRARALNAALLLGDHALLQQVYDNYTADLNTSLLEYQRYLGYMIEMESLRLPFTLEQVIASDKKGLAQGLWRDYRKNDRVIELVASMVLDFDLVDDVKVAEAVLKEMLDRSLAKSFFSFVHGLAQKNIVIPGMLDQAKDKLPIAGHERIVKATETLLSIIQ